MRLLAAARRWLLPALAIAGSFTPPTALAAEGQKHVLVLYATRRDSVLASIGDAELPRILGAALQEQLDYYTEFVDQGRFFDPAYQQAFGEFLRTKYGDTHLDAVIAMEDASLQVVANNRSVFAGVPVVFFALNPETSRLPNSTGVMLDLNLGATLPLVAALQPEVRQVYVVSGTSVRDKLYESLARRSFQSFHQRFAFTYLSGLPSSALEARLSRLPRDAVVYYLLVSADGDGQNFRPLDYLDRVTRVANVPTYAWLDSTLGHGIVGGSLMRLTTLVDLVGEHAVRVIRGEPADSIPLLSANVSVSQVDWRQLRRWGIDEARVPAGTVISFRELTLWAQYQRYIVGAIVVVIGQAVLIAGLLVQRRKRRRAEGQVSASYEWIRDLGARLLNAQEAERAHIARELHDDISQQMALLSINLERLGRTVGGDGRALAQETLGGAERVSKSLHDLSHRLHPARLKLLGLPAALDGLVAELARPDVAIRVTHDAVPALITPEVGLCLFRVAQESLRNALKYSQARSITAHLAGAPDRLTLSIADDGIGFDVNRAWGRGLGLVSMAERVEAIGGRYRIRSTPGAGTTLEVVVPLGAAALQPRVTERPGDGSGVSGDSSRGSAP